MSTKACSVNMQICTAAAADGATIVAVTCVGVTISVTFEVAYIVIDRIIYGGHETVLVSIASAVFQF